VEAANSRVLPRPSWGRCKVVRSGSNVTLSAGVP
jgi:hypothetical protein